MREGLTPEGRILEPMVVASEDAVLVTFWVRLPAGGQDCQGNPEFPAEVTLSEPLGEGKVLDGSEIPPRHATDPTT